MVINIFKPTIRERPAWLSLVEWTVLAWNHSLCVLVWWRQPFQICQDIWKMDRYCMIFHLIIRITKSRLNDGVMMASIVLLLQLIRIILPVRLDGCAFLPQHLQLSRGETRVVREVAWWVLARDGSGTRVRESLYRSAATGTHALALILKLVPSVVRWL